MNESCSVSAKICRLCPCDEFLSNLYLPTNLEIRNVLKLFINVEDEQSTKLPTFICEICKHILESIVEFRDKCKERDEELRAKIQIGCKSPIKTEEVEECLPIEELTIKEDRVDMLDPEDESDFEIEYLEDNLEEQPIDEEKIKQKLAVKRPRKKRDQTKKADYLCEFCKTVFLSYRELHDHKKATHLDCSVCSRSFATHTRLKHHFTNAHQGYTNCHLCGLHINRRRLQDHIRNVHNMERNHKCDQCGKEFFFRTHFKEHLETHNETKSYICDFENCEKSFKTLPSIKHHKRTTHLESGEKPLYTKRDRPSKTIICDLCGKILKTNTGYEIHMRVHQDERPFECKDCDKKFRDVQSLRIHARLHSNTRAYECDLCPMKFTTRSILSKHKVSIHETEMKHECHICGKRTKMKSNLILHMKTHGIGIDKNKLI